MREILSFEKIFVNFGGVVALGSVTGSLVENSITAVIGPNGAGKTTLINVISGDIRPSKGKVRFDGRDLTGLAPRQVAAAGVARTFQNLLLFRHMTALENVMVARHTKTSAGFLACSLRLPSSRRDETAIRKDAMKYLDFVGLRDHADVDAMSLPFGLQRHVEVARALALEPKVLLLDEPAAGLNPQETQVLAQLIRRIRDKGVTVLVIEHDMGLVMNISDKIMVLNYGRKIAEGAPRQIQCNEVVIDAYLGSSSPSEYGSPDFLNAVNSDAGN